jgi:hypothetical protein
VISKVALVAVPVALIAVAVVQRRRNGSSASVKLPVGGVKLQAGGMKLPVGGVKLPVGGVKLTAGGTKPHVKRHKPKNRMRYYGLGLVINALERDSTRKAMIAGLKLAQKRV